MLQLELSPGRKLSWPKNTATENLCISFSGVSELTWQRVHWKYQYLCLGNGNHPGLAGQQIVQWPHWYVSLYPMIIKVFWGLKWPFSAFFLLNGRCKSRPCTVKLFSLKVVSERGLASSESTPLSWHCSCCNFTESWHMDTRRCIDIHQTADRSYCWVFFWYYFFRM